MPGAGNGGSSSAIRAGLAFVELTLQDNKLTRGLANAKAKVQAFGGLMATVGAKLGAVGAVSSAPLMATAKSAITTGVTITDLARRFHTSTEAISGLKYAAEASGGSLDGLASASETLGNKIFEARDGAAGAIQDFARLGLNAQVLERLPLDERFQKIAEAIERIPNPDDKFHALEMIFGNTAQAMAPMFINGVAGFKKLQDEAVKTGAVMDAETAQKAKASSMLFNQAWASMQSIIMQVGMALLPTNGSIEDAGKALSDAAAEAKKWISEHKGLIQIAGAIAAVLAVGAAGFMAFGVAAKVAAVGLGLLAITAKVCLAVLAALTSPIGLVIAAAGLAAGAFLTMTNSGRSMASGLKSSIGEAMQTVKEDFSTAWGGMNAAMKSGDMGAAAEIAWNLVKLEWARGVLAVTQLWNGFKAGIVDSWHDLGFGLSAIWNDIWSGIKKVVVKACGHIVETFLSAVNSIADAANKINKGLGGDPNYWKHFKSDFGNEGAKKKVAEIDAEQKANEKGIHDRHNARLADAKKARDASEAGAKADVDAAKAALEKGAAQAIAANEAEKAAEAPHQIKSMWTPPPTPSREQLAAATRGAFQGPFAQMFGIGDSVAKRNLQANEATADNTNDIKKAIGNMKGAVFK